MKTIVKSAILALSIASSFAMATPASDMLAKLKAKYPNVPFSEVHDTPAPGIFEVDVGKEVLYTEATGGYFFPTVVDMATKRNFGEERKAELNKVSFSDLPLKDAIKTVYGTGARKVAVFSDPNCPYCKQLEKNIAALKDVTVYTFGVGILGQDSVTKATSIYCAVGDKGQLWHTVLTEGAVPTVRTCDTPVARNLELFKSLGFAGTPAIIFASGATSKGFIPNERIEELLSKN